jgi:hypothetical protein
MGWGFMPAYGDEIDFLGLMKCTVILIAHNQLIGKTVPISCQSIHSNYLKIIVPPHIWFQGHININSMTVSTSTNQNAAQTSVEFPTMQPKTQYHPSKQKESSEQLNQHFTFSFEAMLAAELAGVKGSDSDIGTAKAL